MFLNVMDLKQQQQQEDMAWGAVASPTSDGRNRKVGLTFSYLKFHSEIGNPSQRLHRLIMLLYLMRMFKGFCKQNHQLLVYKCHLTAKDGMRFAYLP